MDPILYKVILGALLGGAGCALTGFLLVNLRVPFLAVCLSHAAMAGAVLGHVLGVPPLPLAFAASMLAAFVVGPLSDSTGADPNTTMAILFTAFLGLTFLGIGLTPGPKSDLLSLLWGSILLVRRTDLLWMAIALASAVLLLSLLYKEFKAILFDRRLAGLCGIRANLLYYLLLVLAGGVITVNLYAIGGLMLFSLLVNPAAAALQLGVRFSRALLLSVLFGVVSAGGGLTVSYLWGWPAGAAIVVVSSLVFLGTLVFRTMRIREV